MVTLGEFVYFILYINSNKCPIDIRTYHVIMFTLKVKKKRREKHLFYLVKPFELLYNTETDQSCSYNEENWDSGCIYREEEKTKHGIVISVVSSKSQKRVNKIIYLSVSISAKESQRVALRLISLGVLQVDERCCGDFILLRCDVLYISIM